MTTDLELNELADEITDEGTSLTFSPVLRQAIVQANDGQNVTIRIGGSTVDVPSTRALRSPWHLKSGDVVWIAQQGPIFIILGALEDTTNRTMVKSQAANGALEIGRYLDFHSSGNPTEATDFSFRLESPEAGWLKMGNVGLQDGVLRFRDYADSWHYIQWLDGGTDRLELGTYYRHRFYNAWGTIADFYTNEGLYLYNGWFRSHGSNGWYNQTHGVGIWTEGGAAVKTYNNAIFIGKNNGSQGDWSNAALRSEGDHHVGVGWHTPGRHAHKMTLNYDDGAMYHQHSGGWWAILYTDVADQSTEESKTDVRTLDKGEGMGKVKALTPIRFKRKGDPEAREKFEQEWADTQAGKPVRKIWRAEGEIVPEDHPAVHRAKGNALMRAFGQTPDTTEPEATFEDDPLDHRWPDMAPEQYQAWTSQADADWIGFTAEEVAAVLPEAVVFDAAGKPRGVRYRMFGVLAVQALQELDARVDELEARLARLEARLPASSGPAV